MPAKTRQQETPVFHNISAKRFEIEKDGVLAVLEYQLEGGRMVITHTGVPPAIEGQGIGSRVAQAALDFAKSQGLVVVPLCSFISRYIDTHPDYQDLLE